MDTQPTREQRAPADCAWLLSFYPRVRDTSDHDGNMFAALQAAAARDLLRARRASRLWRIPAAYRSRVYQLLHP